MTRQTDKQARRAELAYRLWLRLVKCGPATSGELAQCMREPHADVMAALNLTLRKKMVSVNTWSSVWRAVVR